MLALLLFSQVVWTTPYDIEPKYQDHSHGERWYRVGEGTGTHDANTVSPWAIGGGYEDVAELTTRKSFYFPKPPMVWNGTNPTAANYAAITDKSWRWKFADGTIFQEIAFYRGRPFNRRTLIKESGAWNGNEEAIGKRPPNYNEVGSCMDCHADPGKHVTLLRSHFSGRLWYGWLRGDDHIFSWRPF